MAADLYAVLGVEPAAEHETVRRAWIRAARSSHPDQLENPSPAELAASEQRIREVNEAWRVLGDEALRREYDRERRRERERAARRTEVSGPDPFSDAAAQFDDDGDLIDVEPVGFEVRSAGVATLLRTLPWLVVGAIGLGIFVFTAFAAGDRSEEPTAEPEPECVRIREDGTVRPVPCRWENDGVIDQFLPLDSDQACRHEDAMPHDAPVHNARLCLVPLAAYVRG